MLTAKKSLYSDIYLVFETKLYSFKNFPKNFLMNFEQKIIDFVKTVCFILRLNTSKNNEYVAIIK